MRLFTNLTPFRFLFGNPIPFKHPEKSSIFLGTRFIPFPLIRGRENSYIREASPLFDSPLASTSWKRGKDIRKRGFLPHKNFVFVGTPYKPLLNSPINDFITTLGPN